MVYSLPFAAMKRTAWERHPFYEDAWGSEDTEWGHWARQNDVVTRYVPEALVMHSHNYTLRQLYGRRFIEGEADAFILGDTVSIPMFLRRLCRSWARDVGAHLVAGDFLGLLLSLPRRWVYHWAYWKGHALGERRVRNGSQDASIGQQVVLKRW
jgi:rhamnosyltransferase